jgi:hypothetical protein
MTDQALKELIASMGTFNLEFKAELRGYATTQAAARMRYDAEFAALQASLAATKAANDAAFAATKAANDAAFAATKAANDAAFAALRAENEAALAASRAENEKIFAANEKIFAEMRAKSDRIDAQMAKNDASVTRIAKEFGGFTNNVGYTTEEYFYNCLVDNPVLNGIKFDEVQKNIHIKSKRSQDEYDLVLYNGDSIALIECKYKIHKKDIEKFGAEKIEHFRRTFTDYADYKYYLGVASPAFYLDAEQYAEAQGYIIIKQKGDFIEVNTNNVRVFA